MGFTGLLFENSCSEFLEVHLTNIYWARLMPNTILLSWDPKIHPGPWACETRSSGKWAVSSRSVKHWWIESDTTWHTGFVRIGFPLSAFRSHLVLPSFCSFPSIWFLWSLQMFSSLCHSFVFSLFFFFKVDYQQSSIPLSSICLI